jgi:hypothetical protein
VDTAPATPAPAPLPPTTSPAALAVSAALPASAPGAGRIATPVSGVIDPNLMTQGQRGVYWDYDTGTTGAHLVATGQPVYTNSIFDPSLGYEVTVYSTNIADVGGRSLYLSPPRDTTTFLDEAIQAAAFAAPVLAVAAIAAPYLSAAEIASAGAPTAAPVASATLPEAALSTVYTAPIPETVISELPAGLTPDMLATPSPIAGTAPAVSIQPLHAPEYLLPQETMMPAAVPETPASLSEMGLTETAPGVFEAAPAFEYPPIGEEYITPTTPAGGAGVPSTWYAGTPSGGGAAPAGGAAPSGGAPAESGAPGGTGGGGAVNAIKSALEKFFAPQGFKPPVATHPQTLLEAAGQYAQENPVTGFALALAIGAGIVGARALIKH